MTVYIIVAQYRDTCVVLVTVCNCRQLCLLFAIVFVPLGQCEPLPLHCELHSQECAGYDTYTSQGNISTGSS